MAVFTHKTNMFTFHGYTISLEKSLRNLNSCPWFHKICHCLEMASHSKENTIYEKSHGWKEPGVHGVEVRTRLVTSLHFHPSQSSQVSLVVKNPPAFCKRHKRAVLILGGRDPWRRAWQPSSILWSMDRGLAGASPSTLPEKSLWQWHPYAHTPSQPTTTDAFFKFFHFAVRYVDCSVDQFHDYYTSSSSVIHIQKYLFFFRWVSVKVVQSGQGSLCAVTHWLSIFKYSSEVL